MLQPYLISNSTIMHFPKWKKDEYLSLMDVLKIFHKEKNKTKIVFYFKHEPSEESDSQLLNESMFMQGSLGP